ADSPAASPVLRGWLPDRRRSGWWPSPRLPRGRAPAPRELQRATFQLASNSERQLIGERSQHPAREVAERAARMYRQHTDDAVVDDERTAGECHNAFARRGSALVGAQ